MLDRKLEKIISALSIKLPNEPVKKEKVVAKVEQEVQAIVKAVKEDKAKAGKIVKKAIKKIVAKKSSKKK